MLVHIFENTPHHYIGMQEFYTKQCTIHQKQEFWVKAQNISEVLCEDSNKQYFVTYSDKDQLLVKLNNLKNNDRVIFHGLTDAKLWLKLIFHKIIMQSSCVIWGYELYRHTHKQRSIKQRIARWIHCLVIQRMQGVFTLNSGDGELVKIYLKRKDTQVMPYPLIGFAVNELVITESTASKKITRDNELKTSSFERPLKVLIGNSAAQSNNHIQALEQISHLAKQNVEVIVPLNYAGKADYIKQVLVKGKELFGNKFTPITQMLSKPEYNELLQDIDMAVFAHNRQQGLYVAYAMLLMGKPLFLKTGTTSFNNLQSLGFTVSTLDNLKEKSFKELKDKCDLGCENNKLLMQSHFTEEVLAPKWSILLNSLI